MSVLALKPMTVTVVQIGTSSGIIVPAVIARLFGWDFGTEVNAVLVPGGEHFERKLISMSGSKSIGIIIPVEMLEKHKLKRGDRIDVPFHEWTVKNQKKPRAGRR